MTPLQKVGGLQTSFGGIAAMRDACFALGAVTIHPLPLAVETGRANHLFFRLSRGLTGVPQTKLGALADRSSAAAPPRG